MCTPIPMIHHQLKILPIYYKEIIFRKKTFEIRNTEDREFKVDQRILLKEWDNKKNEFTGNSFLVKITYVTDYMQKDDYVVFGFAPILFGGE